MRKALHLTLVLLMLGAIGTSAAQLTHKTSYTLCRGLSCSSDNDVCDQTVGCACQGSGTTKCISIP
jgi:hypothetical protein